MNRYLTLACFLLLVVGGGIVIGITTPPGEWYASLTKPSFNPPNWIFGPVWTMLYVLIAIAGWRTWERRKGGGTMALWWAQLILNFAWSPVFFGWQMPGLALAVILALLAAIIAFVGATWRVDRLSALLFLPYAAWVAFASALNGAIVTLN